jgi:putative phosphoesterase
MTTRLLILSDTHIPRRARRLPDELWRAVDDADLVIHAGDWVDLPFLDELSGRARDLVGVEGNNDPEELHARLPLVAHRVVDGVRFAVIHETGAAIGRETRMDERFTDTDVLVFGHSHIPWDTTTPAGLRLLNPGSPTDRRRQEHGTYLTGIVDDGELGELTLHAVLR